MGVGEKLVSGKGFEKTGIHPDEWLESDGPVRPLADWGDVVEQNLNGERLADLDCARNGSRREGDRSRRQKSVVALFFQGIDHRNGNVPLVADGVSRLDVEMGRNFGGIGHSSSRQVPIQIENAS